MLYDVHAHLMSKEFNNDRKSIIGECSEKRIIIFETGLDYETNNEALKLSQSNPCVECCMGMHPSYDFDKRVIKQIRKNRDKIVGVGEVGLDYKYGNKESQLEIFKEMVRLAEDLRKPLIVHSRGAHADVLEAVKNVKVPVLLHYFTGNKKRLLSALENPLIHFSVPASVEYNEQFQSLVRNTPLHKLFCETDSPYTWKSERNTPLNVIKAYEGIAKLKNLNFEEVVKTVEVNIKRVFKV